MKFLLLATLSTILALGFSSCNLLGTDGEDSSTMTATVDGESWESNALATTYLLVDTSFLTLTGNTGGFSASSIIIQVLSYDGPGTYDLGAGQVGGFANYIPNIVDMEAFSSIADNSTGTITISSDNDDSVEGTFSFSAAIERDSLFESVMITGGEFKINKR